jgi:enoyl-CoA hydratase/carnithine racemase
MGIVSHVCPDDELMAAALALADRIASRRSADRGIDGKATRISSTPLLTIVDLIVRVMSRTSGRLHLECLGARYPGIAAAVM